MNLLRLFCFVACVGVASVATAADVARDLIGSWMGTDNQGVHGGFVFRADGSADLVRNGVSFQETVAKGKGTVTYRVDDSVTPVQLDMVVSSGGKVTSLPMIFTFLDHDTLKIRQSNGGPRPKDFDNPAPNEVVVLHREKPNK